MTYTIEQLENEKLRRIAIWEAMWRMVPSLHDDKAKLLSLIGDDELEELLRKSAKEYAAKCLGRRNADT